jgi:hypothetical protein
LWSSWMTSGMEGRSVTMRRPARRTHASARRAASRTRAPPISSNATRACSVRYWPILSVAAYMVSGRAGVPNVLVEGMGELQQRPRRGRPRRRARGPARRMAEVAIGPASQFDPRPAAQGGLRVAFAPAHQWVNRLGHRGSQGDDREAMTPTSSQRVRACPTMWQDVQSPEGAERPFAAWGPLAGRTWLCNVLVPGT